MMVAWLLITQKRLQQSMNGGGVEQICTPQHMGDLLRRIIHHDSEMIGRGTIMAR